MPGNKNAHSGQQMGNKIKQINAKWQQLLQQYFLLNHSFANK